LLQKLGGRERLDDDWKVWNFVNLSKGKRSLCFRSENNLQYNMDAFGWYLCV
jgi:hypothetical protein